MKILLDAFSLTAPKSGIGYYTYYLLHALKKEYPEHDYIYFYGRRFSNEILEHPPIVDQLSRSFVRQFLKYPHRIVQPIKEFFFKAGVKKIQPNLYHATNLILMPFSGPQVVTSPDMSLLRFPETHPVTRLDFFHRYFTQRLKNAQKIIAISEFTKKEMLELTDVNADKITVIPLAAPIPDVNSISAEAVLKLRQKYNLSNDFFLYLGNIEPRKNIEVILDAFSIFVNKNKLSKISLVLVGSKAWLSDYIIKKIEKLNLKNRVIMPGYVPHEEVATWYKAAQTFFYPSKYEGFGLPVLEAMSIGTPVICSNSSSLPEVVGNAARLLEPNDVNAWAASMIEVADSKQLREQLSTAGLIRNQQFSWSKCAKQTMQVYQEILS